MATILLLFCCGFHFSISFHYVTGYSATKWKTGPEINSDLNPVLQDKEEETQFSGIQKPFGQPISLHFTIRRIQASMTTFLLILLAAEIRHVVGHARLIEPPSRNTLWRFGYNAPANFEDSELFCGGIKAQWADNKGKCGVCGDSYSDPRPRRHETGSAFDKNITVRTYAPGEEVVLIVDVVANHLGYFEFAICERNDSRREEDDCFKNLRVKSLNSTEIFVEEGNLRYRLKTDRKGLFYLAATLPEVTCSKCILRWHWRSANNWGTCDDGKQMTGCGPQETYRNCADIAIGAVFMGVRGSQGANVVPPKQISPPTRDYELQQANKYHSSAESRLEVEPLLDIYKQLKHNHQ